MHLCRFSDSQHVARLGLVREGALYDISDRWPTLSAFLGWSGGRGDLAAELASALAGATPVSQFDQLMPHKAWVPVGDQQMAFALLHINAGRKLRRPTASGIDGRARADERSVIQPDAVVV